MSLKNSDWPSFIAEVIPEDVVFQIVEDGELHEIKAHKIVMGMGSITFKTMFYTTDVGDKTTKEIKIEATTKQAFQIIIDDLYNIKSIEDSLEGKSLQEVFDVVNLMERYQMEKLQEAMYKMLSNYPITDDTVLEVAVEAIHQSGLFQKEAHLLLITCAKYLKSKLKDVKSITKYVEENEDKKEVVAALLARMNGIAPTECSNCGYEDCQDGKEVKEGELREGLLVTNNRATGYNPYSKWSSHDYGTGKVKKVDATHVEIVNIKSGIVNQFNDYSNYSKTYSGCNLFLFMCN